MTLRLTQEERWNRAKIGASVAAAYTNVSARVQIGASGTARFYRLSATTDCYIRQGNSAVAATSSDYPLYIGQEAFCMTEDLDFEPIGPDGALLDDYIAAIRQTTSGTLTASNISNIS